MNAGILVQHIVDTQRHLIAFAEPDERRRHRPVYADGAPAFPINTDGEFADMEVKFCLRGMAVPHIAVRRRLRPSGQQSRCAKGERRSGT